MKLLVVEDDPRMAELLRRGLSRDGSAVTVATTVRDAQDEVLTGHFDVAVCDVMLPDGSGLELCRWVRDQKIWIPLLLLDRARDSAYEAGPNVVHVYVRYLRRKLAPHHADRHLVTVRGRGYLLDSGGA